jgi:tRNA pseudouridine55 synthase
LNPGWDGLLLVDKPSGPTSHDIVAAVRRATGQRRVGHAGTLDPLASGLLPLVLGVATRLVRFLPASPKDYTGTLRLGLTTHSDDVTGEVLERHRGALPDAATVIAAAATMRGRLLQDPPTVSARKVGGRRLYRLARQGVAAKAAPAEVDVRCFDLEATDSPAVYRFLVRVSAGTYVRALVRDLGLALGCGGAVESLRRTAIERMEPDSGLAFDRNRPPRVERLRERLIPPETMPLVPPPVRLEEPDQARRFLHGDTVSVATAQRGQGPVAVYSADGQLLGVAEQAERLLRPRVVLSQRSA